MKLEIQPLSDGRFELSEGPVWWQNALWWVDIKAGDLHRWDPAAGAGEMRHTGEMVGAAVPCEDGRWLLAQRRGLSLFDWESGARVPLLALGGEGDRNRFNDGKCDPQGRFWAGTMSMDFEPGQGNLYRLDAGRTCTKVLSGVTISNGLAWSSDSSRMYYVDTPTLRVDVLDFDPVRGEASHRRPLTQFTESDGWPDGLTIDEHDNLWVALFGGSAVASIDGRSGEILERIPLPVRQPTSCVFGGPRLDDLCITSAWQGMSEAERKANPLAGSLLRLQPGVRGCPVSCFRGSGSSCS